MTDIVYPSRRLDSSTDSVSIAGTIVASNPSVGPTGTAVPASGTYIGVNVGGNLTGLTGTANGLKVDGSAVTQPVSGTVTVQQSTAANLKTAATISQGGNDAAVTASNALKVDGSAVTQPISGSVTATVSGTVGATQSGTWNLNNITGTVSLPTGAATAAKQPAFGVVGTPSADVLTVQGAASMNPLVVSGYGSVGSPTGTPVAVQGAAGMYPVNVQFLNPPTFGGRSKVFISTINYSSTPVTTSAYTLLVSSTSGVVNQLTIADTSGSFLIIAVGAFGSEVDQLYIGPGGSDSPYELRIPAGSAVWVKALDVNATSGRLVVNGLS